MENNYALVDKNNNVVNVVVFDDAISEEAKKAVIEANGAVLSVLVEDPRYNYNSGHYENEVLWIPKPYPSFIKDLVNNRWIPPVPYPNDGKNYDWDEPSISWKEVVAVE